MPSVEVPRSLTAARSIMTLAMAGIAVDQLALQLAPQ